MIEEAGIIGRLTGTVGSRSCYDYSPSDVQSAQLEALDERFQSRKERIRLLGHRAQESGLTRIASLEDAVPLLFPHTAYKSYPENFLMEGRWDRLGKWLETISSYPVSQLDRTLFGTIDDWLEALEKNDHFVSCSSGTTGKSAMLVASRADLEWVQRDTVAAYSWGSGVRPAQDRRIFAVAAAADVPRNRFTQMAYHNAFQDRRYEPFNYPIPPITVGTLTEMVVLRRKIAEGTASPAEIQKIEDVSSERQRLVDDAVGITARALVDARHDILHVSGYWLGLYTVAKAIRGMGFGKDDFRAENSIYASGGLKGAQLPEDYREFVYETFNIRSDRNYLNYSMQELHSSMPRCREGGRYHLPPWLIPMILNENGDVLLPRADGEYEGRAAFFDLSIDGRWGGVISGDKVAIQFSPCRCGNRSPSIRDNVVRFSDLQGDDKIGCAGTVDAYVRGVS